MNYHHALITGGAGFIGSHLAELLVNAGCRVSVVDDLSTGRLENLQHLEVSYLSGDAAMVLRDPPAELETVDVVFHLAATVGVERVMSNAWSMLRNNLAATEAAIDFALMRRLPILLASSSEIYGPRDTPKPLHEDMALQFGPTTMPRWGYALTKAMDEHLALAAARQKQLPVVVVRLFNTVGPRQRGEYGMVLPRFVQAAIAGSPLPVFDDGQQKRTFCDVADTVQAMVQLIGEEQAFGRVFNVGGDQPVSIQQLAERVIAQTGSSSRIEHVDRKQWASRADEPRCRVPDIRRVAQTVGWRPQLTLNQTISRTMAFYH